MWKPEHRRTADRRGLRYPSDLTDAEWALVHWRPKKRRSQTLIAERRTCTEVGRRGRIDEASGQVLKAWTVMVPPAICWWCVQPAAQVIRRGRWRQTKEARSHNYQEVSPAAGHRRGCGPGPGWRRKMLGVFRGVGRGRQRQQRPEFGSDLVKHSSRGAAYDSRFFQDKLRNCSV
jgi:hypothetical protein